MEHFHKNVPGWASFGRLYIEVVRWAPQKAHFVEVGSWLGRSAALMAVEIINSGKDIRFDCIDPWSDGGPDLRHKVAAMKEPIFDQFKRNIAPVANVINAFQMPSLEGAKMYEDGSLDFVMIDGSHQYEDVKDDINAWLPKIRSGGILSGDDYNWSGVSRAVQELLPAGKFEVINTKKTVTGTKKGPARYWTYRVP